MKKIIIIFISSVFILGTSCNRSKVEYPKTQKGDVVDNYFGTDVPDPYRWLEDDQSEDVASWVNAQNEVTFNYLNQIPFRDALKNRLSEIWNYTTVSTPFMKAGKIFTFKREGLQNQAVLYIQDSFDDEPRVLIDPNTFSDDGTVALSAIGISRDAKYIGYAVSEGGSDWQTIKVRNIKTGKDLSDEVKWVKFSGIQWHKD